MLLLTQLLRFYAHISAIKSQRLSHTYSTRCHYKSRCRNKKDQRAKGASNKSNKQIDINCKNLPASEISTLTVSMLTQKRQSTKKKKKKGNGKNIKPVQNCKACWFFPLICHISRTHFNKRKKKIQERRSMNRSSKLRKLRSNSLPFALQSRLQRWTAAVIRSAADI